MYLITNEYEKLLVIIFFTLKSLIILAVKYMDTPYIFPTFLRWVN